jgi:Fic family protein
MKFELEKPRNNQTEKDVLINLIMEYQDGKSDISKLYMETLQPDYVYWDKVKYNTNIPPIIKKEDFWSMVKFIRKTQSVNTVIKCEDSKFFTWIKLPKLEKFLHEVDLNTGGNLFTFLNDVDENNKYKFISRGVMEEAIASSQLEGAHTTREVAKEMLREGRKPRNTSEQMILNSYKTMQAIETTYKEKNLSLEAIFEMHGMITDQTVDSEQQGRFRKDDENIVVSDSQGTIFHVPPKSDFVKSEMGKLIKFANDELNESFLHPVIKAIMIHFWIGYLHPFTDGNGRLARVLFYWYLLKKNYWAFAYLPISKIIKKSPVQYGMSYVYAEQDDLDLTYFIDYNLHKIELAVKEFEDYLKVKSQENALMNKLSKSKHKLNDRQIQLLQYYYKNKDERTTINIHQNINQISRITAYTDLKKLIKIGFIKAKKIGKTVYYYPTDKISQLYSQNQS